MNIIIFISFLINVWIVCYGQNEPSCSDCSFNIVATNIDDIKTQNGYYILNECDVITDTTIFDNSPLDLTIVGRKQLLPTDIISHHLVQMCISYDIIGIIPDCMNINTLFLPVCSNTNTSKLMASDINQLIMNGTFDNGNNVKSAVGVNVSGHLGILVELIHISNFRICIGNIIINPYDLNKIYTVDTSDGIIVGRSNLNNDAVYCNMDGLPCFNFLFRQACSPNKTIEEDEVENERNIMESSETDEKADNMHHYYNVTIDFSYWAMAYLWSVVLFVIGVIGLNMMFYHCCLKNLNSSNSEGEESDMFDIILDVE